MWSVMIKEKPVNGWYQIRIDIDEKMFRVVRKTRVGREPETHNEFILA